MDSSDIKVGLAARVLRAVRRAARAGWSELRPKYNWQGIYCDFEGVVGASRGFDAEAWAYATRALTERTLARNQNRSVPEAVQGDDMLLPFLVSIIGKRATLRIVDFGGGAGLSYAMTRAAVPRDTLLDYIVVELPNVVQEGTKLFSGDNAIRFVEEIPESLPSVDVVFISTALQYAPDWKSTLQCLARLGPRYFLLTRLSAGDVPTYVAAQINYQNARIPYRFLDLEEFVQEMHELGYARRFLSASGTELNQANYPAPYRLSRTCNVLFTLVDDDVQRAGKISMQLRKPTLDDLCLLFGWINDPLTIRNSRGGKPVAWETHSKWLPEKLLDQNYRFFVGLTDDGCPCGLVWFYKNADGIFETSLNLASDWRGKRISEPLLRSAILGNDPDSIYSAEIHNSNVVAIKVFRKCGFKIAYTQPNISTYVRVKEVEAS